MTHIERARTKQTRLGKGYTAVRRLELQLGSSNGMYSLVIELAQDESPFAPSVTLRFFDVSQLTLKDFAGGLSQFQILMAEDVSERQLDRIKYVVTELENGNILFTCRSFSSEERAK